MFNHVSLGSGELIAKIKRSKIKWGGNRILKIYGKLSCTTGKRMKKQNRVFFVSEAEALQAGYRPCARCLPNHYQQWISSTQA